MGGSSSDAPGRSITHQRRRAGDVVVESLCIVRAEGPRKLAGVIARKILSRAGGRGDDTVERHFVPQLRPSVRVVRERTAPLEIVYVTERTSVSGGHRVIFEHLNRLAERGHQVELHTLDRAPDWFTLRAPVRTHSTYRALAHELSNRDCIKVATWWATAEPVLAASSSTGVPVYLVLDIETSYYAHDRRKQAAVLGSYRPEFAYLTESRHNGDRLGAMGLPAEVITPGVDHETFRPLDLPRRDDVVLTVGRSHYLKNLRLSWRAWRRLPRPRPELWMFGIEPELGRRYGAHYVTKPSDSEVNALLNEATAFIQTSRHEGFCLPLLEAMAAGIAVVCTDADGNRDFCVDGINCLMPDPDPDALGLALKAVLSDPDLRAGLRQAGLATAARFDWSGRIDRLEEFFTAVARG